MTLWLVKRIGLTINERRLGLKSIFIREFDNPKDANDWLNDYIKKNHLNGEDYIIKREVM